MHLTDKWQYFYGIHDDKFDKQKLLQKTLVVRILPNCTSKFIPMHLLQVCYDHRAQQCRGFLYYLLAFS